MKSRHLFVICDVGLGPDRGSCNALGVSVLLDASFPVIGGTMGGTTVITKSLVRQVSSQGELKVRQV
jgi:hypothetical protein